MRRSAEGSTRPGQPQSREQEKGIEEPRLLRAGEAAEALSISKRKLWELTSCGEIPVVRIGRGVRYDIRDLRAAIDRWKQGRNRS